MRRMRMEYRAFTLVELLIVVAIISLLIAIIVPSLSKARYQARNTRCTTNLRTILLASNMYVDMFNRLPELNNEADEGAWQYNYVISDGRDFNQNLGPLLEKGKVIENVEQLFCPIQESPFHKLKSPENPWPPVPNIDTRAGYGRRYHMSGKSFSEFRRPVAYTADLMHLPGVVRSGHKSGVNAVYTDGHVQWVRDPGVLTNNALASPFSRLDNPIVKEIWEMMDTAVSR